MDGTLVESENLWEAALQAFYARHGGRLSATVREATVGSSAQSAMHIVHTDLGLGLDPATLDASARWLHDRVGALFAGGLSWCAGAEELLDALAAAAVPMALVTNTARELTERALDSIGRDYFAVTVCGDEVPRAKPAPDPYLAAATALGVTPGDCLVIEDSVTGTAAAQAAGCPVLVVPNAVAVPTGPGRFHAAALTEFDVAGLAAVHRGLRAGETDVTSADVP